MASGHDAPGGQRDDDEHPPTAASPDISAAARLARKAVIWLTAVGRAARLTGCGQAPRAAGVIRMRARPG